MLFFRYALVAASLLIQPALAQESAGPKPAVPEDEIVVPSIENAGKLKGMARAAVFAFQREDYVRAEKLFKELAKTAKEDGYGEFWVTIKDFNMASGPFTPPPEAAVLEYLVGLSAARQGKLQPAEAAFLRALVIDPKYNKARADLTLVYVLAGDLERAQSQLVRLRKSLRRCSIRCDALKGRIASLEASYKKAATRS